VIRASSIGNRGSPLASDHDAKAERAHSEGHLRVVPNILGPPRAAENIGGLKDNQRLAVEGYS
jgi:hypothetical protein